MLHLCLLFDHEFNISIQECKFHYSLNFKVQYNQNSLKEVFQTHFQK